MPNLFLIVFYCHKKIKKDILLIFGVLYSIDPERNHLVNEMLHMRFLNPEELLMAGPKI